MFLKVIFKLKISVGSLTFINPFFTVNSIYFYHQPTSYALKGLSLIISNFFYRVISQYFCINKNPSMYILTFKI